MFYFEIRFVQIQPQVLDYTRLQYDSYCMSHCSVCQLTECQCSARGGCVGYRYGYLAWAYLSNAGGQSPAFDTEASWFRRH